MFKARIAGCCVAVCFLGGLAALMFDGREAFSEAEVLSGDHKLARFQLEDYPAQMRALQTLGFDIAGVDFDAKTVDLIVDHKELEYARNLLEKGEFGLSELAKTLAPDSDYQTPEELADKLREFANAYPEIAQLESIGKSLEGRDIWALKISDNPHVREQEEPTILFNAMHHAREVMTTEVALDTIDYLLGRYGTDNKVTGWVDNNEIWVVPMLNPDGNHKVWHSDSMWRKNARGGYGVDINRNYPYAWNSCGGSSGNRYSQSYRGSSPASEPETNALMNLVARIRPVFSISYHSYSEMVLYPYGCSGKHSENRKIVAGIGKEIAERLPSDDNPRKHYRFGTPWEILYAVDGGDIDWMHHEYGVLPYVIELNSSRQGFQPSFSRWRQPTVEKVRASWSYLLDRLEGPGIRGRIALNDAPLKEGVTIEVKAKGAKSSSEDQHFVKSDGSYHIILEPGIYEITFQVEGRSSLVKTIEVGQERISLDIELAN